MLHCDHKTRQGQLRGRNIYFGSRIRRFSPWSARSLALGLGSDRASWQRACWREAAQDLAARKQKKLGLPGVKYKPVVSRGLGRPESCMRGAGAIFRRVKTAVYDAKGWISHAKYVKTHDLDCTRPSELACMQSEEDSGGRLGDSRVGR